MLRPLGRAAIWFVFGLLLFRGLGAVLKTGEPAARTTLDRGSAAKSTESAFAVGFARTYLADPTERALRPFLAEGARVGTGLAPGGDVSPVAQAEVSSSEELGGGRLVITVACELRDARTLYLAVPIVRSAAGEVAALGAPSIVAAPGRAGVDPERPQPLAGPEAGAIEALVAKFIPAYLAAPGAESLSYLLAPGAVVQPLGGELVFGSVSSVTQLGSAEGHRRSVVAAVRASDPTSRTIYPLAYRLELVKRGRWYVNAVEGVSK